MFEKYFLMKSDDVLIYAKNKLADFQNSDLECKEIGDGNLNYVFRVIDKVTKKSVIIKQGYEEARISADIKISTDRNRIEAEILKLQNSYAPGYVPKVYEYDSIMSCIIMEDLSDYEIMRSALMRHKIFPNFSEEISTFLVRTLLLSSDLCMEHKEKKNRVQTYINPELCEITEQLVYTEPYFNCRNRNNIFSLNERFVQEQLYNDSNLHLEVTKLKFDFMNNAQSLIHGDLHTGSIFISQKGTKVIDPEFGFYGPMGYDIGNIIANLIFSWNNANATIEDSSKKEQYLKWIENEISKIIDLFKLKFVTLYDETCSEKLAKNNEFMKFYLENIISDTAGVAGLELIRRTVGLANVKDITSITNVEKRKKAERINILVGKKYILNRNGIKDGQDFVQILKKIKNEVE